MKSGSSRAFTLIELLIVVAIIGILAAIAIPNFLNAQIRAKAARAKADLRTLATGVEEYGMDWGVYPNDYYPVFNCWGGTWDEAWDIETLLFRLTTPVEYLSSLPYKDPFGAIEGMTDPSTRGGKYMYVNDSEQPYWRNGCGTGGGPRYSYIGKPDMPGFPQWRFLWYLKSSGPDKTFEWWGTWEQMYDPTNGVVSAGEIPRAGP